jgi:tetratricopeptide (TPR) repeat protein
MKADCVDAHYGLARALQAQGDFEQALRTYRAVADLMPDFQDVTARLADLARKTGSDVGTRQCVIVTTALPFEVGAASP